MEQTNYKFQDVCEIVTDYVANGSFKSLADNVQYSDKKDYARLIRLVDYNNNYDEKNAVWVPESSYNFLKKSVLYGDEVIISNVGANLGTVFKCPKLNYLMTLGPNSLLVRTNDLCNQNYLYYYLKSKIGYSKLMALVSGSAMPKFNKTELRNMEISLPDREYQDKAAEVLIKIDKKIELNNKINNNLLEQNKSLYNEWFVNFNFEYNGKKYKESNGEMINSEYGLIPKNWSLKRIDEMNLDISDGNYSSKYPTKQEIKDEGIQYIRGTDFVGYSISKKSLMFITPEKHSILKKGHLKKNDILITTRGEIGRIAFVSDDFIDANINAQLIRVNGGSIYPRSFLGTALISDYIQNDIQSLVTGTALQQLPVGKFNQIKFLIPDDHKIIEKFDEFAEYNLKLIQANEKENELLEQIRDILLPKLMNGEIDLDNIEI